MAKMLSKATIKRRIKSNGGIYKRTVDEVVELIREDMAAGKGDRAKIGLWFLGFSPGRAGKAVSELWAEQGKEIVDGH